MLLESMQPTRPEPAPSELRTHAAPPPTSMAAPMLQCRLLTGCGLLPAGVCLLALPVKKGEEIRVGRQQCLLKHSVP